jgi:hypothetical protein
MFFGASGSIAGGTMLARPSIRPGTYAGMWYTDAGYALM